MLELKFFTTIEDVPLGVWEKFVKREAVGLEPGHLKAVEESGINNIRPHYIIAYDGEKAVGIAYCFTIEVNMAGMANTYPQEVLVSVKTWNPDFMKLRVVEVGHLASIGKTIEVLESYTEEFLACLSRKIDKIAKIEDADICMIRDISNDCCPDYEILKQSGYYPAKGFPVASMQLSWNSFEQYLDSLKSKRRNNIKQKRTKLQFEEISVEIIEDYAPYAERLAELWANVAINNNGYEHERLTPEYFRAMSKNLKGRSHVVAIKQNEKIVAYGLNLIGDKEYFGVAEGLDYNVRDKYSLYANNIFEGLRVACELGKKTYNIGVTTYDFKTSIGAELEPCTYFIKSFRNKCFSAVYANFIQENIVQPHKQHRVFREETKNEVKEITEIADNRKRRSTDPFEKHYNYLRPDEARASCLYPYFPVFESAQEPEVIHNGKNVIMLGTNSYLGLATHPKVKAAAHEAIDKYGSGCSGSPLLNGTLDLHLHLNRKLALFTGKEDALVCSTGYQTNVGAISVLAGRHDVLIMDERNHASLLDGARLSGANLVRHRHNDMDSLEYVLKRYENKPKIVVTDSLFSMEGTIVNLPGIVELTNKYGARLMLDESHAIGVLGKNGGGVTEYFNLEGEVDIIMGTFSKSFASIGGFVAGETKVIDTLKHKARAHVFSASLPPSAVAAVLAAIDIVTEEPYRRIQLHNNARYLAQGLNMLGYKTKYTGSPIIPVFCGHELLALAAYKELLKRGVFVNPVMSPAVPKGQELLRISLMANHSESILRKALEVFKHVRTTNWPQPANN